MGRRKPHPTKSSESARAYLVAEGNDPAAEILSAAAFFTDALRRTLAPLTPKERNRAQALAAELRPLAARSAPNALETIDLLLAQWSGRAKRGRRPDLPAQFTEHMLWWAVRYWEPRGLGELTATQVMAAAVAAGLEPASDPRGKLDADALAEAKEKTLDSWRKHHSRSLPRIRAEFAEEARQRDEDARRERERPPVEQLLDAMSARPCTCRRKPQRLRLLRSAG